MGHLKEVLLYLQDECNYSCEYCMLGGKFEKRKSLASSPDGFNKIVEFFNKHKGCHIFLTGGEPSVYEYFIELAQELTKNNFIRLDTNNSFSEETLQRFIKEINPHKVDFIQCSLHEIDEEETRLKEYIERVKRLQNSGFKCFVSYVALPKRVNKLEELSRVMKKENIPFVVTPFRSPEYPKGYSQEEREEIYNFINSASQRALFEIDERKPKGKECSAGYSRVNINCINGSIKKCWRSIESIGNIYEGTLKLNDCIERCDIESCTYTYEIHLNLEELACKDLNNVILGKEKYDENIYKEYIKSSL